LAEGRWDPRIREELETMIWDYGVSGNQWAPEAPPIAAFDWDNTAIQGDIGEAILDYLDERDNTRLTHEYERQCQEYGKPVGYPWAAYQVAGLKEHEVRALTLHVIDLWMQRGRIRLRPEIRDLIASMQHHGWHVWVVSASAEPLVRTFGQYYGIPACRTIGMRLQMDEAGRYIGALAGPSTFRQGKVDAIDQRIGRRPLFAAGDTDTDIEMLQCARYALLMDRGSAEVREAADRGGWWVQPPGW